MFLIPVKQSDITRKLEGNVSGSSNKSSLSSAHSSSKCKGNIGNERMEA